jgi:hypothetical protein
MLGASYLLLSVDEEKFASNVIPALLAFPLYHAIFVYTGSNSPIYINIARRLYNLAMS